MKLRFSVKFFERHYYRAIYKPRLVCVAKTAQSAAASRLLFFIEDELDGIFNKGGLAAVNKGVRNWPQKFKLDLGLFGRIVMAPEEEEKLKILEEALEEFTHALEDEYCLDETPPEEPAAKITAEKPASAPLRQPPTKAIPAEDEAGDEWEFRPPRREPKIREIKNDEFF